jgi:integrase
MVAVGRDPASEMQVVKDEPLVSDLWEKYWKRHGAKKKSGKNDEWMWKATLEPRFGKRKLSKVTYDQVCDMMDDLKHIPIQANRRLALLSKMFNFAKMQLRWSVENPCKGVQRYPENKRQRYMTREEAARIFRLLNESIADNPGSVAFIYLLIFTGARSGEIASARWEHLDGNVLRLPDSKTGARPVYLPRAACEIIDTLPRTNGTITGIKSPKKLWDRIRQEAGTPDLRLHDLRHSFASFAIGAGHSLAQIGGLLGHSNAQTTMRYAHLMEEAAAEAAQNTVDHLMDEITRIQ